MRNAMAEAEEEGESLEDHLKNRKHQRKFLW